MSPRSPLVALISVALGGCSSLYSYPAPRAEVAPFCADGIDNDFDGRIDCSDPDCTDSDDCTRRESAPDCSNGADDDRDGYTDRADPQCWHLYDDPWDRCESARTGTFGEGFDDLATGRWMSLDLGAPRVVANPVPGDRTDTVAQIVPGPRTFTRSTLVSPRGELRVHARWRVPEGAEAVLQIWSAADTDDLSRIREAGLLGAVRLRGTADSVEITVVRGLDSSGPVAAPRPMGEWFESTVQVSCGRTITATVGETHVTQGEGDCYARSTSPTFAPLGPLAHAETRLGLLATGGPVWVDDLYAESLGAQTCARRLPRLVSGDGAIDPPSSPRVLSMAMSGDPENVAGGSTLDDPDAGVSTEDCSPGPDPHVCALVLDRSTGRVESWVSREAEDIPWGRLGSLWTRSAPLDVGSVSDASVEWTWMGSCRDQGWRATLRSIHGTRVFESQDCEHWTVETYLIADVDDSWAWHAYFVRAAFGDQRIPQREEVYAARRGTTGLVFGRAYRQRNVFSWTGLTVLNERDPAQVYDLSLPISLTRVGTIDQLMVGRASSPGLIVHVVPAGIGGEVLAWQGGLNAFEYTATLEPSGLPGTPDRWDVDSGAAIVVRESDGNPFALALFTSTGDYDGAPGSEVTNVGIACRQVSRRNPPCEESDPIIGAGCGDGFCFGNENCAICPLDCGGDCAELPQMLSGMISDHPATAHPTTGGAFSWVGSAEVAVAGAPIRGGATRSRLSFDISLDGDSDDCMARVGLGESFASERGPVGDFVEIALEDERLRFRPLTRGRDGVEMQSTDPSDEATNAVRWQHVLLWRREENLEVRSYELDLMPSPRTVSTGPMGSVDPTTVWIEIPPTTGRCQGRIRNLIVE